MSKRFIFPQQNGERKKAKLNVTISDHNFPLSQNAVPNKESNQADTWGDENDDEILLLASQACEQAYNESTLPDYSMCMLPTSTSTQMYEPGPSTSTTPQTFKKPHALPPNLVSNNLKDKCNRISSPLPGISSKVTPNVSDHVNLTDDLIFNDKIYKGQDSGYIYRQLLQLQEENAKIKSENGKLLEKCVTKEGEAFILRTQLKSCQMAVDNARMERIKAQEKVQMEWTEKLSVANGQMHDLRTQLDFKNLEIISIKERCRMLESNKVKLTQVNVVNNDISSSHRNSIGASNDFAAQHIKKVKTSSNSVQTDDKALFLRLHKSWRTEPSKLTTILPLITEPTPDHHSLLEYNEKLQKPEAQNRCRIFSTFHRIPSSPAVRESSRAKVTISCISEELACIAAGRVDQEKYYNVFNNIKTVLSEVVTELEMISQKVNTAFLREMDEKYIEATCTFTIVTLEDLLSGRLLYKEEQGILARRMVAILFYILHTSTSMEIFNKYEEQSNSGNVQKKGTVIEIISIICKLLDSTSCAVLYSGLLLSISNLVEILIQNTSFHTKIMETVKCMITSRPKPYVSCQLLQLVRRLSVVDNFMVNFCPGSSAGNLKMDHDQGVLLYKKDSCFLQILVKQVEASLRSIEKQQLASHAAGAARHLLVLHHSVAAHSNLDLDKRCACPLVLVQVTVYALRICAVMLGSCNSLNNSENAEIKEDLLAVCRSGVQALYQCSLRDVDFATQLSHNEGHLIEFCELMKTWHHAEPYVNMLTELSGTFQSSPEDMTSSFHRQAWLKSFETFSMAD